MNLILFFAFEKFSGGEFSPGKFYIKAMSDAANNAIILFDGVCNFCNGAVNFIIERDPAAYFKFAPLQSEIGAKLLREYEIDRTTTDSVVLIENGVAYTQSTAALRVARKLSGWWKFLYSLRFVPQIVRDFAYKLCAKNRYKLFGKRDACLLPTPEIRARFLATN